MLKKRMKAIPPRSWKAGVSQSQANVANVGSDWKINWQPMLHAARIRKHPANGRVEQHPL
jgi:hypothetical protein